MPIPAARAEAGTEPVEIPPGSKAALVYPASPATRLVTGESLKIDGGWTAR
jgi:hypothetical protein